MEMYEEGAYMAKHCMKEKLTAVDPAVVVMTADVPEFDFDRANLKRLALENNKLRHRNAELEDQVGKAAARIHDLKERNGKLERALIEATIK